MAYRGVHFALTDAEVSRLLAIREPDELVDVISEEIEEAYFETKEWCCETDKAWDPIHRCLGDGRLEYALGPYPLTYAVLGGTALDAGEDYTACLTTPAQLRELVVALAEVAEDWLEVRFEEVHAEHGNSIPVGSGDFRYVWDNFEDLRRFLARAAAAGRHVLFTVDA
jgi:hypothetical protein